MRRGWADAFGAAVAVAALFFSGCSGNALASDPLPERRIELKENHALFLAALQKAGHPDVRAPADLPAADANCAARFGAGHFAVAALADGIMCVNPQQMQMVALDSLCALRWPDSEAAMLMLPELVLFCRVKGKAV